MTGAARADALVAFRLTSDELRELRSVAALNLTTVSGVLRQAVNEYASACTDREVFRITRRQGGATLRE